MGLKGQNKKNGGVELFYFISLCQGVVKGCKGLYVGEGDEFGFASLCKMHYTMYIVYVCLHVAF